MLFPAFTYRPDARLLPDALLQGVAGADRPWCAALAALAAATRGDPLLGMARKLTPEQTRAALSSALAEHGIPLARQLLFTRSILNTHVGMVGRLIVNGLMLSGYQQQAINRLTIGGGLLAMAVGLGKTVTATAAAIHFAGWSRVTTRCWIVAPLTAMPTWKPYVAELAKVFADVRIISVDSAHKLKGADRAAGGVLIIDEVHLAGHQTARRTKALFDIRAGFDYCLGLTGTLLHSGVEPALTMLDLVLPGAAQFATKWAAGEYFHCLVRKQLGARTVTGLEKPAGPHRAAFLQFMAQYAVVMTKHSPEVQANIHIPEQAVQTIEFGDPSGEDADDCIVRIAVSLIDPVTGELPHASEVAHAALREGAAEKIAWFIEHYDPAEPVVVFAEYKDTLTQARAALDAEGIAYVYVDGDVVGDDRALAVKRFQAGEVGVFLGQIDAAGAAIDLFRAQTSITLDHTQRAANYSQSLGRTCRRGQTQECLHLDLVANCLQRRCVQRLRSGEDFHMDLARVRAALDTMPRVNT